MKVLVLGATGLLGQNLVKELGGISSIETVTQGYSADANYRVDLTDKEELENLLVEVKADFIVNCVALTDVDRCQKDCEAAFELNSKLPENLKDLIDGLSLNSRLIQISSDMVYDKQNSKETEVRVKNVYSLTKYCGEKTIKGNNSIVLRTNFFGGDTARKKSFTGWIREKLLGNEEFFGFDDVVFSPLHVETLSKMIVRAIFDFKPGVYNLGASTSMSKYEFIQQYAGLLGRSSNCRSARYDDLSFETPRPKNMSMDVSKFEQAFNVELPSLESELRHSLESL